MDKGEKRGAPAPHEGTGSSAVNIEWENHIHKNHHKQPNSNIAASSVLYIQQITQYFLINYTYRSNAGQLRSDGRPARYAKIPQGAGEPSGWLEFAGLENDGVEQEQTCIYCIRWKTLMCKTCNCFKHKSTDIYYTAFRVILIKNIVFGACLWGEPVNSLSAACTA